MCSNGSERHLTNQDTTKTLKFSITSSPFLVSTTLLLSINKCSALVKYFSQWEKTTDPSRQEAHPAKLYKRAHVGRLGNDEVQSCPEECSSPVGIQVGDLSTPARGRQPQSASLSPVSRPLLLPRASYRRPRPLLGLRSHAPHRKDCGGASGSDWAAEGTEGEKGREVFRGNA